MNKRQARAYALRCLAAEARHHIDNDSGWLNAPLDHDGIAVDEDGQFSDADRARVVDALRAVANEPAAKAQRMRTKEKP